MEIVALRHQLLLRILSKIRNEFWVNWILNRGIVYLTKGLSSWISSGSIVDENSVSVVLTKKFGTANQFLFGRNQINVDQILKNIALSIFENEAPEAALSNYRIHCLRSSSQGNIYL